MDTIKWIHVSCVILSGLGFFVRGVLMVRAPVLLSARSVKIAPHVVDTLLLVSGIVLASQWGWAALQLPWLVTKVGVLLVYIGLGTLALRTRKVNPLRMPVRVTVWLAALGVYIYIIAVAVNKTPFLM